MTGYKANRPKHYRSFEEARKFARSLNLGSSTQWREYCKSGDKPGNIPTDPRKVYLNKGWNGFADWLGKSEVNYEELSTVQMTETVRKGIDILVSSLPDKYRRLEELLRPSDWNPHTAYPVTFMAAQLGFPYHRVKYQIDKEYLHRYDQERRRANRLAAQAKGDFELGDELVNNSLGFCLRVPVNWRVSRWESNETAEDYGQEASFNREGKLIPRRIGYTQLSAEPVTSPSPVDWSLGLEVDKYQLEEPLSSLELWDRCTSEGFLRGELGERHYRPGAPLKIAGMDAVRHIVLDPHYPDQKWTNHTYSVYMCDASHGWSISLFFEYSGTFEEIKVQHQLQRATFFGQIAPSFRTIGMAC